MIFTTILKAIDPTDGELKTWGGPNVEAISWGEARHKIQDRGYLEIDGVLVSEVPVDENGNPDFDSKQTFCYWN